MWQSGRTDTQETEQGKRITIIGIKRTRSRSNHRQPEGKGVLIASGIIIVPSLVEQAIMQIAFKLRNMESSKTKKRTLAPQGLLSCSSYFFFCLGVALHLSAKKQRPTPFWGGSFIRWD